ncbi:dehydrogenase [Amylibacter kogurei]|uniref:Dehydrogenase n=1 Tax=Paramylibacter kogurei TaxID=1889778 RepID=A0A2G5KA28_9RHOB|nr:FAD-dependent oxidoreductase [Amylibacter kogurei]PIB25892.1 dehydrogenase [Amylibacter kogurei]
MRTHAQAVVIGGGLVGCSILYHLAKLGWRDVVLLERDELTSGSTWHAAANLHGLHDNNNISKLQYYTMNLYKELELETGQGCGVFQPGSLYLAQTEQREHQLRIQAAKARYFNADFYELSIDEAQQKNPLVNFDGVRCVMFEPDGGNVDPSGVTHAYAAGARNMGAEIHRFTPVTATTQRGDGTWDVVTPKGSIHTPWVVNVAGLWGREVAAMAGINLPLQPTEHQYLVTETIPEIAAMSRRLPSVADRDGEYYMRQEGNGLLIGAYEKDMRFWAENGTPAGFGHELFADDLDRIMDNVMRAMDRVPAAAQVGIKRVINGPMIWSPDSAALYGPVPEKKGYFCCNGIIPGFSQSGGLGLMTAQWIVEGEPEFDMFPWDVARFGAWADKGFTRARVADQYANRFKIHFPYEERTAGRPMRMRPVYEKQKSLGAVFGLNYGWEHPLWFAGEGAENGEEYGFDRQNWFEPVGEECRSLRNGVGVIDISNFAKYEIVGSGARDWLNRIVANYVPTEIGRSCLTPLIGVRGGIAGDFTITMLGEDHYWMVGSGMAERYHQRYFNEIPRPETVAFNSRTDEYCGFNVAGPQSRELLSRLTQENLSNDDWKFMRSRQISIAGLDAIAMRVSFTGDLGWELYIKSEDQLSLYNTLLGTGVDLGVHPVGSRALGSLRIEKGYGSWGREYSPEYWPQEVGLDRLIKMEKPEFLGKSAYAKLAQNSPREKLVILEVNVKNADASGGEPVFLPDGAPVGRVSSGAYGYTVEKSLALCFIKAEHVVAGAQFDVAILGQPHRATLLDQPPFDPTGEKLRS